MASDRKYPVVQFNDELSENLENIVSKYFVMRKSSRDEKYNFTLYGPGFVNVLKDINDNSFGLEDNFEKESCCFYHFHEEFSKDETENSIRALKEIIVDIMHYEMLIMKEEEEKTK